MKSLLCIALIFCAFPLSAQLPSTVKSHPDKILRWEHITELVSRAGDCATTEYGLDHGFAESNIPWVANNRARLWSYCGGTVAGSWLLSNALAHRHHRWLARIVAGADPAVDIPFGFVHNLRVLTKAKVHP